MTKIEFTGRRGNLRMDVKLLNPSGGGHGYHVYLDKFYYGTIVKLKGEWVGHMNLNSDLTEKEILNLCEIIDYYEEHGNLPGKGLQAE